MIEEKALRKYPPPLPKRNCYNITKMFAAQSTGAVEYTNCICAEG